MWKWFGERKPDKFTIQGVQFIGEQDGEVEREFEARIVSILRQSVVTVAYLARVRYSDGQHAVALCLGDGVPEDERLAQRLLAEFVPLFRPDLFLDVFFLTSEQAAVIKRTCRPFFERRNGAIQ